MVTIGITWGYHRCFAHNEIKVNLVTECIMLYFGLLCGGRSALSWCGVHRMHHAYSDTPRDPHSPLYKKWYEIVFSSWRVKNIPRKFVKDLYKNYRVMFFHKYGLLILLATWALALYWNVFHYLFLVYLLSYIFYGMLNLFGHSENGPINKWWINLFAPFEGQHKNHHETKHIKS
jgi:fatty-acid desaturase